MSGPGTRFRLDGKVALVTSASSGIGKAIAMEMEMEMAILGAADAPSTPSGRTRT